MLPDGTKSTTSRFLLCASTPPASTDSDQPSRQQYTGAPRCGRSISSVTALHRQSAKLYGTRSSRRYYARARTRGSGTVTWRLRSLLPTPHGELQPLQGPHGPTAQPTAENREKRFDSVELKRTGARERSPQQGERGPPWLSPTAPQHCVLLLEPFIATLCVELS